MSHLPGTQSESQDKFPNSTVKNKYYVRVFTSVWCTGEIQEILPANITNSQLD